MSNATGSPGSASSGTSAGARDQPMAADVVVDATGRGARMPAWLAGLGYERPAEDEVPIHVRYASQLVRMRPGDVPEKLVLIAAEGDPRLSEQFARVTAFLDKPPRLMRPSIALRVLNGNLRRRKTTGVATPSTTMARVS